ncbi:MAG TPA: thioredoxin domain-containing protein, partial [Cytophagales bacterium]|nr:thioredoxin domain-containing protein [Cytophagales bacterium]
MSEVKPLISKSVCLFLGLLVLHSSCSQTPPKEHKSTIHTYTNKLAQESSPYLLQHAHNPVHWMPWGEEALNKAKKENKPLLISIGYAACHWCHVMEQESFMDTSVAHLMNTYFVPIKVDREERPDIDQIYMDAVHIIGGHGGWPLNAFALPDGRPFHAGTYYPNDEWKDLLQRVHESYIKDPQKVTLQAEAITKGIAAID